MRKKIITIFAIIIILASIGGATLAYFSSSEAAENIISSSNLTIVLHDEQANGAPFPKQGISNVLPGQKHDKIVYVENNSDNPEWIRIHIESRVKESNYGVVPINLDYISVNINTEKWIDNGDGWYYYKDILEPGQVTSPLFTKVIFDLKLPNSYMDSTIYITPYAQAVQSIHNGATVLEAEGWPYVNFNGIGSEYYD